MLHPGLAAAGSALADAGSPRLDALADALAQQTGLPRQRILASLSEARFQAAVTRLILPGRPEQRNWRAYRDRFVNAQRIDAGARFVRANAEAFARAQELYGVPRAVIAGILGVETLYGRQMGSFRVLDALGTLALDFPAAAPKDRSAYFASELGDFLLWCDAGGIDPASVLGSYAGAIGMPQFMPGSILRYGASLDGGQRVDLVHSASDAIASVGNFLHAHGWTRGQPVRFPLLVPADLPRSTLDRLLLPDIVPSFGAAELRTAGLALLPEVMDYPDKLAVVQLPNVGEPPDYVLGTDNFYAITRYNHSALYALAVIELGEAVDDAAAG